MNPRLTLYSRSDCSLCDEMKSIISEIKARIPLDLEEIDVDSSPSISKELGVEVPVLLIDGRKAFKYRVTTERLERCLRRRALWARLRRAKRGGKRW